MQTERNAKEKFNSLTFLFIAEVQLVLSKDNANRAQCKRKVRELNFSFHCRGAACLIKR